MYIYSSNEEGGTLDVHRAGDKMKGKDMFWIKSVNKNNHRIL